MGEKDLLSMPDQLHLMILIPLSKTHGIFKFNQHIESQGAKAIAMKDDINANTMGSLANNPKFVQAEAKMAKDFGGFFDLAQGCCVCLPMHINKQKASNAEMKKEA